MRLLLAVLLCLAAPASALAADSPAWQMLREGARVVLVRHGATSGGAGDPAGFQLEDCATQRNLTDKGRADAKAAGEQVRAQNIPVGKVISSRWCRCRDTASLMALGPIEIADTFNNAFILRERIGELTRGARELIARWKGPGVLVVVTHGANILPLTGIHPAEGEMIVIDPEPAADGRFQVIGRIAPGS